MGKNQAPPCSPFSSLDEVVADMRAGKMVVVLDEAERKNEAKLVLAAERVSAQAINFMARHARGLVCLALTRQRCEALGLLAQDAGRLNASGIAFTASIEAAKGVTTGISAADRALTIKMAATGTARDIVQPGHVFPLQAAQGGVLVRAGHTEAACELAQMAGYTPAAVVCALMQEDGSMVRAEHVRTVADQHQLKVLHIADLIVHCIHNQDLVRRIATRSLQTLHGPFTAHVYQEAFANRLHIALVKGQWRRHDAVPVRIHDSLSLLDLLVHGSVQSDACNLHATLCRMQQQAHGVVVLLNCGENAGQLFDLQYRDTKPTKAAKQDHEWQKRAASLQMLRGCGVSKPIFWREQLCVPAGPPR